MPMKGSTTPGGLILRDQRAAPASVPPPTCQRYAYFAAAWRRTVLSHSLLAQRSICVPIGTIEDKNEDPGSLIGRRRMPAAASVRHRQGQRRTPEKVARWHAAPPPLSKR